MFLLERSSGRSLRLADTGGHLDEPLAYERRSCNQDGRDLRAEDIRSYFAPELDPTGEVLLVHLWDGQVGHHGVAFVAAGGEQDGSPEISERGKVLGPVIADDAIEDGAEQVVLADAGVETVDEHCDALIIKA